MSESLQIVGEDGNNTAEYFWLNENGGFEVEGWYNEDGELVKGSIPTGNGFLLYTSNGSVSMTTAGQVKATDIVKTTVVGFNVIANSTPVAINIQDIVISGDNVAGDMSESLQIVGSDGNNTAEYFWLNENGGFEVEGWYDEDGNLVDVSINAGTGFLLYTSAGSVTCTIPAAL